MSKEKDIKILKLEKKILELEKVIVKNRDSLKLYVDVLKRIESNGWILKSLLSFNMNNQGGR